MGLDMARVRKDMKKPEVEQALREDFALAQALGLNGTPSYVVGDQVVVGAVGLDTLKQKISRHAAARRRAERHEPPPRAGAETPWSQNGTMVVFFCEGDRTRHVKGVSAPNPVYADAREPVMAWFRQVKSADWATPTDVKRAARTASILKDGRVVFNIAGNKYRIVVWINYPYRVVYIRFIGTHRQYDQIDAQTV